MLDRPDHRALLETAGGDTGAILTAKEEKRRELKKIVGGTRIFEV